MNFIYFNAFGYCFYRGVSILFKLKTQGSQGTDAQTYCESPR